MKNALKCAFGLLDLFKIWEDGTFLSEKSQYLKKSLNDPNTLPSNPWLSKRNSPNFLRIIQKPNFDIGFQKKHVSGGSEDLENIKLIHLSNYIIHNGGHHFQHIILSNSYIICKTKLKNIMLF